VLGNRVDRVASHVRDDDAALRAGINVERIMTGCRNGNHLEPGELRDALAADRNLVGDRNVAIPQPLDNLRRRGALVLNPIVLEVRPAQLQHRRHGAAVEEYDAGHVICCIEPATSGTLARNAAPFVMTDTEQRLRRPWWKRGAWRCGCNARPPRRRRRQPQSLFRNRASPSRRLRAPPEP